MSPVQVPSLGTHVLFVCANNICRSPIAEGVFRAVARREGLHDVVVDSAGIFASFAGRPPDPRAINAATARGYDLSSIRARQVTAADFTRFDWILAMDESNLAALVSMSPLQYGGHLGLLMDVWQHAAIREVPDPYFGASAKFDEVVRLVEGPCLALAARLAGREASV